MSAETSHPPASNRVLNIPELCDLIASFLAPEESSSPEEQAQCFKNLCSARFLSRAFCSAVPRYIAEFVNFNARTDSLVKAEYFAKHPDFRPWIREVRFEFHKDIPELSKREFKVRFQAERYKKQFSGLKACEEAFRGHKMYFRRRITNLPPGELSRRVRGVLSQLPNLSAITMWERRVPPAGYGIATAVLSGTQELMYNCMIESVAQFRLNIRTVKLSGLMWPNIPHLCNFLKSFQRLEKLFVHFPCTAYGEDLFNGYMFDPAPTLKYLRLNTTYFTWDMLHSWTQHPSAANMETLTFQTCTFLDDDHEDDTSWPRAKKELKKLTRMKEFSIQGYFFLGGDLGWLPANFQYP